MNILTLFPKCDHCGRSLQRRFVFEGPRFCSYQCGLNEQPQYRATSLRNTGSGNDPETHL